MHANRLKAAKAESETQKADEISIFEHLNLWKEKQRGPQ